MLAVRQTKEMGRGVFALRNFETGDIVERCQVIAMEGWEHNTVSQCKLNTYVFGWNEHKPHREIALALGNGSLYNHSYDPNMTYNQDQTTDELVFIATKPIKAGEELFINYGYDPVRGINGYENTKRYTQSMAVKMPKKRDEFIDAAVEELHQMANEIGAKAVSKETLSFIVQRYIKKYNPPRAPREKKKRAKFRAKLKAVE